MKVMQSNRCTTCDRCGRLLISSIHPETRLLSSLLLAYVTQQFVVDYFREKFEAAGIWQYVGPLCYPLLQ